jgi:hypothetical protein
MRITRDLLINTAKDTVKRQTYGGHDLVCAYLTGSLIYDQPLLGGLTDIDLIYVHTADVPCSREIVPVTDEIHLDIAHYPQSFFSQPRQLRTDAWVGSFLCQDPIMLYDTSHWFEYTQAGVAAQFYLPTNTIQRVKYFSERARSAWLKMQTEQEKFSPAVILAYLRILKDAANAVACLTSVPLTERRFLLDFPERAMSLQMPGLVGGFNDLLLPEEPVEPNWETWLENWRSSYSLLLKQPNIPQGLSDGRMPYYEKAILDLQTINQEAALWILLWTGALIANLVPAQSPDIANFNDFCSVLSLDESHFSNRLSTLDTYLDIIEEAIDKWSYDNGL